MKTYNFLNQDLPLTKIRKGKDGKWVKMVAEIPKKKNSCKKYRSLIAKIGLSEKCADEFGAIMFRHYLRNVWTFESWYGKGFVLNPDYPENRFKYCKALLLKS